VSWRKSTKKIIYVAFGLTALIAITDLFWDHIKCATPTDFLPESAINGADTAWILASSSLVLLMTPRGCRFFTAVWWEKI
jgi:Amt family ammonium transporter